MTRKLLLPLLAFLPLPAQADVDLLQVWTQTLPQITVRQSYEPANGKTFMWFKVRGTFAPGAMSVTYCYKVDIKNTAQLDALMQPYVAQAQASGQIAYTADQHLAGYLGSWMGSIAGSMTQEERAWCAYV